jgi:hypothetical protein
MRIVLIAISLLLVQSLADNKIAYSKDFMPVYFLIVLLSPSTTIVKLISFWIDEKSVLAFAFMSVLNGVHLFICSFSNVPVKYR